MSLVVALVPAKSNSRRLPGKNMRSLGGKPLFLQSVEVALKCDKIDKVIVSSDSTDILTAAEQAGAIPLRRPLALCGDDVPNFEVCRHVVETLAEQGEQVDQLVLLQPTQPFRTSSDLAEAVTLFAPHTDFDSLVSIKRNHRMRGLIEGDLWSANDGHQGLRAQASGDTCEITGHLFILRVNSTVMQGSLLGERKFAWTLPATWFDIDIDTKEEFQMAQGVASEFFVKSNELHRECQKEK